MMRVDRRGFIVSLGIGGVTAACIGERRTADRSGNATSGGQLIPTGAPAGLIVRLSGLLGLVRPTSGNPLRVLLVDGQATLSTPHTPRLIVPNSLVVSRTGPTPTHPFVGSSVWDLTGYQLTIGTAGTGMFASTGVTVVTNHRVAGSEMPTHAAEEDDISWVADITKVPGATGSLNPACLAADPRAAYVAARVVCPRGTVAARFDQRWKNKVFQFASSSATYKQALGLARIGVPLDDGETVKLTLTPFDTTKSGASAFEIVVAPEGTATAIEVANEPSSLTPPPCTTDNDARELHHFAAYYKLLSPAPAAAPNPVCVGANCPSCTGVQLDESDWVYCPPANF